MEFPMEAPRSRSAMPMPMPLMSTKVKSNESLPDVSLNDFDRHGVKKIMDQVIKTYPVACCFLAFEDGSRQVLSVKAANGIAAKQLPFHCMARHHIARSLPIIVCDTGKVERVRQDPLVLGPPFARFYVGAPLMNEQSTCVGTLCIMDTSPRDSFTLFQCEMLVQFAEQIMDIYRAGSGKQKGDFASWHVCSNVMLPDIAKYATEASNLEDLLDQEDDDHEDSDSEQESD
ncbi:unnamed protein product [Polarella glacialis]|uniref:GAF domain-containing protein n=1 Tax=Polarella glacialis TaxID=89957 RepID=A0A813FH63_POLGL|nr:unnamed protein product [Polarella glacialis]